MIPSSKEPTGEPEVSLSSDDLSSANIDVLLKKKLRGWGWVLGLLWLAIPFLCSDPYPEGIDIGFHLRYAEVFSQALNEGDGWPDWDASPYNGRGAPTFRYYAPLPYLLIAALRACGIPIFSCFKLLMLAAATFGAWGIRCWIGRLGWFWATEWATFLTLTAPPILIHFYMVFFFQNYIAMMFLPWVCVGWWSSCSAADPVDKGACPDQNEFAKKGNALCMVSLGLMGWCHLPAAMVGGYSLVLLALVEMVMNRSFRPILRVILICGGSGLLMAPYALPAMLTLGEIRFHLIQATTPWGNQTFLDSPSSIPVSIWDNIRVLFFYVVVILSLGITGSALRKGSPILRDSPSPRSWWWSLFPAIFFLFMNFRISEPFWRILPGLPVLQMPWRLILPTTFLSVPFLLVTMFPEANVGMGFRVLQRFFKGFFLIGWLGLSLQIMTLYRPLDRAEIPKIMNVGLGYPFEYLPKACSGKFPFNAGPKPFPRSISESLSVSVLTDRMAFSEWEVGLATGPIIANLDIHYDSSWRLEVDGRPTPLSTESTCGLMTFPLEAGNHRLLLKRITPPFRNLGWLLFSLTFAGWIWFICRCPNP